jgi:hypothetical protein
MSRRAKHEDIGPSAHDFEAAVVKVFGDYPDALLVLPEYLEEEAHQKIKARFPKATRLEVRRAIRQMLERKDLCPFTIAGAMSKDGADVVVYELDPSCRLWNVIPFPG